MTKHRYNVTIQCIDPGAQGINVTVTVDAANVVDALAVANPQLVKTLESSGLMVKAAEPEPEPAA